MSKMMKVCRAQGCNHEATKELGQLPVCQGHYDNTMVYGRPLIVKGKGKGDRKAIA